VKDWYVPQQQLPTTFPQLNLAGGVDLDPAEVTWANTDGGAPTVYSIYLLAVTGDPPQPPAVAELEQALAGHGWSLSVSSDRVLRLGTQDAANPPDAWVALQALRKFAEADGLSGAAAELVKRLSLHRLAFIGMPAKEGHAGAQRAAVASPLIRLSRRPVDALPGRRRPVVAILDSGIGRHDWMNEALDDQPDPIHLDAADLGWQAPGTVSAEPADFDGADPRTHSHAGHGTFIAGLIRQCAPDARLLSMHVMRADGIIDEQVILSALEWLVERVRGAEADPQRFVDVVCLAFGYYEQTTEDSHHTIQLRRLLGELGDMGVRVVASAGNHASDAPVFPAALTALAQPDTVPRTELVSVGALNPDLSQAAYSNFGDWVMVWTVGTALVSAMPLFGHQRLHREPASNYLEDNLASGFARWSGTSFAAAVTAGLIAAAIMDDDDDQVAPDAAHGRAGRALDRMR
jgi:hypothetical protein